jgi:hypothetical protein
MCAKEIRNPQRGNQPVKESDQDQPNVEMLLFTYGISRDSRFRFSASAREGLAQRVTTVASRLI